MMEIYTEDTQIDIESVRVSSYEVPTETPESDGTYEWDATTLVLVEITAGDQTGIGYTYADTSTAHLIRKKLVCPRPLELSQSK